nr:iron-containing redox enzyme family protein [Microbacterium sp. SORGH_AS_0428]
MSLTAMPRATLPGLPFAARGPLSEAVALRLAAAAGDGDLAALTAKALSMTTDVVRDDDIQLALFCLYANAYGSLDGLDATLEWDAELLTVRQLLESTFEAALRREVSVPALPAPDAADVAQALFALTSDDDGPSLSRYLARKATDEQAREFLIQRTIYTLREADPHSWAIPRLRGRAKAALVEIQSDEYGGGRPDRVHAEIFAHTIRAAGLDDRYGAYVDDVPAVTLASHNAMSMFGLNRRLLGAIVGHLAAFEMTSSIPNRLYGDGLRRLGYGDDVTDYFDEHVEADAVHEQIAGRDLAGALAEDRPDLLADIMFGAAACLAVDGWVAQHMHDAFTNGVSSLRGGAA